MLTKKQKYTCDNQGIVNDSTQQEKTILEVYIYSVSKQVNKQEIEWTLGMD